MAKQQSSTIPHLLAASELTKEQIQGLLKTAKLFSTRLKGNQTLPLLKGKTVVNLFFENSTRTRTSFEIAVRRLEGGTLNFASTTSSVQKGETLIDTAKNIQAMGPHCIVVRHSSAGSPVTLSKALNLPIINAGDGFHEHPTQGLLDAFTIQEKLGEVAGKRVMILGDIAHSRVARSNIHILRKLGATVVVCGPPSLLPPHPEALQVEHCYRPESILPQADVVIALRIQLERQNSMQIPSLAEYSKIWGLSRERASLLKKGAIILHPGPINRGIEIDPDVADDEPRSVILDQVHNGILVRMAVLAEICNPDGLTHWMNQEGTSHAS
ncbi:MAG: aspartate carbamoyltransferase catalytic subunit [Bdellovibrio sp.]|nr:aspartate carbamoyltransferase catalytic subunit [Bdellovibrio sp.]